MRPGCGTAESRSFQTGALKQASLQKRSIREQDLRPPPSMRSVAIRCRSCNARWRAAVSAGPRFEACPNCGAPLAIPPDCDENPPTLAVGSRDFVIDQVLGRDHSRPSQYLPLATIGATLLVAAIAWFVFTLVSDRDSLSEPARRVVVDANSPGHTVRSQRTSRTPRSAAPSLESSPAPVSRTEFASSEEGFHEPMSKENDGESAEDALDLKPTAAESAAAETGKSVTEDAAATADKPHAASPGDALVMAVGQNFKHTPIQDIVNYLTETTGVTFQLDMKSLWFDQGMTKNAPVTIDSEKLTIREFLDQVVVKQMRASYQVRDDRIVIVSRKAANKAAAND